MQNIDEYLQALGFKVSSLMADFAGSIASLVANKQLSFWQSVAVILTGVLSSGYITPAISDYFSMGRSFENVLAFFLGIFGMFIVVGMIRFGEDFAKAPLSAIKNLLSLRYFYVNNVADVPEPKPKQDDPPATPPTT